MKYKTRAVGDQPGVALHLDDLVAIERYAGDGARIEIETSDHEFESRADFEENQTGSTKIERLRVRVGETVIGIVPTFHVTGNLPESAQHNLRSLLAARRRRGAEIRDKLIFSSAPLFGMLLPMATCQGAQACGRARGGGDAVAIGELLPPWWLLAIFLPIAAGAYLVPARVSSRIVVAKRADAISRRTALYGALVLTLVAAVLSALATRLLGG